MNELNIHLFTNVGINEVYVYRIALKIHWNCVDTLHVRRVGLVVKTPAWRSGGTPWVQFPTVDNA
jgi:hypothetical protein